MSNIANDFMSKHSLAFRCERVEERPDGLMGDKYITRHFRVEFRTLRTDFALVTFFSQGSAHTEDPTAAEVLECLASDARSVVDCTDVLDFAYEMGYASDDMWHDVVEKLRATYNGCRETLEGLDRLLGEEARDELLELDFYE
jgi:hypothetical protein